MSTVIHTLLPPHVISRLCPDLVLGGVLQLHFTRCGKFGTSKESTIEGRQLLSNIFVFPAVLESKLSLRENIMTSMLEFAVAAVYAV